MFDRVAGRYGRRQPRHVGWRRRAVRVAQKKAIGRLLEGLAKAPRLLDLGAGTLDGGLEIVRRAPRALLIRGRRLLA